MTALTRGSTRKIYQLIGNSDREHPARPAPRTFDKCGLYGTDVGAILDFGSSNDLLILFGDTWGARVLGEEVVDLPGETVRPILEPVLFQEGQDFFQFPYGRARPFNADAIGIVPACVTRDNVDQYPFELDFYKSDDGKYATLEVPGVNMLTNSVPTGAIPTGTSDGALVFVTGKPYPPCDCPQEQRSWIAPWPDTSKAKTEKAFEFSRGPFACFAFPLIGGASGVPGTPDIDEPIIWLWGTGFPSRGSSVRLARARLGEVVANPEDRNAWEFFAGSTGAGAPRFADERAAVPLFDSSSVGEFSVCWNECLGRWLLLYNSLRPRGIVCRSAPQPWGPWDDGVVIFDPRKDNGYGHFIYDPEVSNGINDLGHDWYGGEYAPILVPRFNKGSHIGKCTIRYLMSTWNPYTVVLMETELALRFRIPRTATRAADDLSYRLHEVPAVQT